MSESVQSEPSENELVLAEATRIRCNNAMGIDFVAAVVLGLLSAVGLRLFPVPEDLPGQVAAGVFVLYFFFANSLPGDSLGMRLFGLRVISAHTGRPCNPGQAFLRTLFHPLHLGNAIARTRVVYRSSNTTAPPDSGRPVTPS